MIRDGRILALGGPELLGRYRADRVIDLDGRLVMPGFNDTSMVVGGGFPGLVDLTGSRSIDEIGLRIHGKAEALGPGRWVRASGWSEGALVEGRRPSKEDLDIVAPDNPVVVGWDSDGILVNQAALDVASITWDTASPEGGEIERGPGSQPTGVLRGTARRLIEKLIPAVTASQERATFLERLRALPLTQCCWSPLRYLTMRGEGYAAALSLQLPWAELSVGGFDQGRDDVVALAVRLSLNSGPKVETDFIVWYQR